MTSELSQPKQLAYQIHLNFVPVIPQMPDFKIWRTPQDDQSKSRSADDVHRFRLPREALANQDFANYCICFHDKAGYEQFNMSPFTNPYLTVQLLAWSLKEKLKAEMSSGTYMIKGKTFWKEVFLEQVVHPEGIEELVVQPYFLRAVRRFGFIFDYHFRLNKDQPFSRRIQQLSLSLDGNFRKNLSYYVDRYSRIRKFIQNSSQLFKALPLPDTQETLQIGDDFMPIDASRLKNKAYLFGGSHEAKSQFLGLTEFGPMRPLEKQPILLFAFQEEHREWARKLAKILKNPEVKDRFSYPGFKSLFKIDVEIDKSPVILADLTEKCIKNLVDEVKNRGASGENIVPIVILPEDHDGYFTQKALFSNEGIASQVCTLGVLRDERTLYYAAANIALQIFCKAGGQPWKVQPAQERSLIIGISQSHKMKSVDGRNTVEKYFAFSVLTDSSGLFQSIQILGDDASQQHYLKAVRENLQRILQESTQHFTNVIIHTSFKLKKKEMSAVEDVVKAFAKGNKSQCRFAVVKVNHKTRFFGVNRGVNSLVPYEATKVKLGPGEYLVWFEGIFPSKTTVSRVFPGPTHLQILHMSESGGIDDQILLQDLVNLSGANWRGFNAKSSPVSVFYCHLIADLYQDFHERNLPLPTITELRPWFL